LDPDRFPSGKCAEIAWGKKPKARRSRFHVAVRRLFLVARRNPRIGIAEVTANEETRADGKPRSKERRWRSRHRRQAARRPAADAGKTAAMTDDPVDLDTRRSAEGKIATDIRRHSIKDFEADRRALRQRQDELEAQLLAEPAANWHEAAIKAQYLIRRYSETAEACDTKRQELIARVLGDFARLTEEEDADR